MKKEYKLYAMDINEENIEYALSQRFSRITPSYILVYKRGNAPKSARRLREDEAGLLCVSDSRWLISCNLSILEEELCRSYEKRREDVEKMIDNFEKALKEEAGKLVKEENA